MLKNYLTITLRNLRKHPGYAFINLFGLALGLVCCLLIFLFVRDELSYDRFHEKADRTYRIVRQFEALPPSVAPPPPLAPALMADYPEVEHATRMFRYWFTPMVSRGDQAFNEEDFLFTDPQFFEVFDFPFLQGNPATALNEPGSLILTASMAAKYFGDEDPMGQTLQVNVSNTFTVTGVMADTPSNSHFRFDFLTTLESATDIMGWENVLDQWGLGAFPTYVVLPDGYDPAQLEAKLPGFVDRHFEADTPISFTLQPLTNIHLHSNYTGEWEANSDMRYVYLLVGIALIILLLACINYTNLATARFARRAKEVGIRKTVGAQRQQLILQFLGESVLLAGTALVIALAVLNVVLPAFNQLVGRSLDFNLLAEPLLLAGLVVGALLTGLIAGSYPALYLSHFRPSVVLKTAKAPSRRVPLRTALVVAQYTIATVFIIGTVVIYQQLDYIQTKKLGFEQEQVVLIPVRDEPLQLQPEVVKNTFRNLPTVEHVSASTSLPGLEAAGTSMDPVGPLREGTFRLSVFWIDDTYTDAMDVNLVTGRTFAAAPSPDTDDALLLNESAVTAFGWASPEEAMGETIRIWGESRTVIGVVEDFHFESLREPIQPLLFLPEFGTVGGLVVRVRGDNFQESLAQLAQGWEQLNTAQPFTYTFLDQDLAELYDAERRWGRIIGAAAMLAILIACLGLFGLAAYAAEQRTKEIGVRKVLGASVGGLVALLTKDFARLVLVAFVVAVPLAYYAAQRWLDSFAYRMELGAGIFLLAGGLILCIALFTVSYQAIRAALTDPVKSLRYE